MPRETRKIPSKESQIRRTGDLQVGDVVADHVMDKSDRLLVRRGVALDEVTISALEKRGIEEILIQAEASKIATGTIVVDESGNATILGAGGQTLAGARGVVNVTARVELKHEVERLQLGFSRVRDDPLMMKLLPVLQEYLARKVSQRYGDAR